MAPFPGGFETKAMSAQQGKGAYGAWPVGGEDASTRPRYRHPSHD